MAIQRTEQIDALKPDIIGEDYRYTTNKYYASNQTLIYIGTLLVDEAVACNYVFEQRKVPIYPYNSSYYSKMASGKVIVTGNLSINYIDSAYLFYALHSYAFNKNRITGSNDPSAITKAVTDAQNRNNALMDKIKGMLGQTTNGNTLNDRPKLNSRDMKEIAQLVALDPVAGQEIMQRLRSRYWGGQGDNTSTRPDAAFGRNFNGNDFKSQGGINFQAGNNEFTIVGRPDQMPEVNITVAHGNPLDPRNNVTYRVLRDVSFTRVEQSISPTGQNQLETYSFFARSIDF